MSIARPEHTITAQVIGQDDSRRLRVVHERERVSLPAAEAAVHGLLREEFFALARGV